MRYKPSPITATDAVRYNGENFMEVQALCPQAEQIGGGSSSLWIPLPSGEKAEAYPGEVILKSIGKGEFAVLESGIFDVLYEVQSL